MKMQKALLLIAAVAVGTEAYAEKVKFEQLPPAVQQAIRSRSGRSMIEDIDRETRNGQVTYEASWKERTGQQELLVSEQGTILRDVPNRRGAPATTVAGVFAPRYAGLSTNNVSLSSGSKLEINAAPAAVQMTITNSLAGARLEDLERGTWNGRTVYEAAFKRNGKHTELQILDDGTILTTAPGAATANQAAAPVANNAHPLRYAGLSAGNVQLGSGAKVSFNEAPPAVKATVTQASGGANVEDFERGQWNGRTVYEAAFKRNGQHTELQVLEDGSILTQAPAAGSPASGTIGTQP